MFLSPSPPEITQLKSPKHPNGISDTCVTILGDSESFHSLICIYCLCDNTGNFWEFSFVNLHLLLFWKLVIGPCLRAKTKTMSKNQVLFHSGTEVPQRAETQPSAGQSHSFWIYFRDNTHTASCTSRLAQTLPLHSRTCLGTAGTWLLLRPAAEKQKQKKADGK